MCVCVCVCACVWVCVYVLILDGSAGSDHGPGQHMIVLKGELQRGEGESTQAGDLVCAECCREGKQKASHSCV